LSQTARGIKAALVGLLVNIALVIVKLLAGIAGHSYALVADAIESSTDIFSSLTLPELRIVNATLNRSEGPRIVPGSCCMARFARDVEQPGEPIRVDRQNSPRFEWRGRPRMMR